MSTIKIDSHRYNTSRLNEKIKTYDFDETTSVNDLLELINDQADNLISLETKCLRLEEENKNLKLFRKIICPRLGKYQKKTFSKIINKESKQINDKSKQKRRRKTERKVF